jgi:hypothetical protein
MTPIFNFKSLFGSFAVISAILLSPMVNAAETHDSAAIWEKNIKSFENTDKASFPKEGSVLFIGSSSIVMWETLAQDMAPIPVINRGFGGSWIRDSIFFANRIVFPYKPSKIVFYAGENDIAGGISPAVVAADWERFVGTIRHEMPGIPIFYISLKPSPSRVKFKGDVEKANEFIKAFCGRQKGVTFVDVYTPMLNADGSYKDIYLDDKLHMNADGYKIWTGIVKPLIEK